MEDLIIIENMLILGWVINEEKNHLSYKLDVTPNIPIYIYTHQPCKQKKSLKIY